MVVSEVRAPISTPASLLSNAFQLRDVANIHDVLRLEQLLPHRWDEVGASCDDPGIVVPCQERPGFV